TTRGQTVLAPLTGDGKKCRVETAEWYVRYKDADGEWQEEKGYTDREATEALAAKIRKREERRQSGLVDRYEAHHKRPLAEHLTDFETALALKAESKRVNLVMTHVRNVLLSTEFKLRVDYKWKTVAGCGFRKIPDVEAFPVERVLIDIRNAGVSIATRNNHLRSVKQFWKWLVEDRRTCDNPFSHLKEQNVDTDRRRERRELSSEEVQRLLEVAANSPTVVRRLTGDDRFVIYYLALGSGLRAAEIGSLKPESFDLDSEIPIVVVEPEVSKHRKRDEQPLQPDLVAILRDYLQGKPAGELLWPSSWNRRAAEMLRSDLKVAGIPYIDDAGRYADFHAQRHTYITVVGRNLPPKMAQLLARHRDYKTTERYTHLELHDTGAAAAQLPPLLPETDRDAVQFRATGTDDERVDGDQRSPHGPHENCFMVQKRAKPGKTGGQPDCDPEEVVAPKTPRKNRKKRCSGGKDSHAVKSPVTTAAER
ncbi:MAG: tyrosine-type recombinase/integrase, partial [Planctomycetota bacterium]